MKEGLVLNNKSTSYSQASIYFYRVVLVCLVAGVTFLAVIVCWFRKCRHGNRYEYSSLEVKEPHQTNERVELERKARDHSLLICQQYLNCHQRYEFLYHLNDIGSRYDKHWFIVKDVSIKTERLLTLVPKNERLSTKIELDANTRELILDLFRSLQHPYIYPVLDIDFIHNEQDTYAVLVLPFNPAGSLKDLIYNSSWDDDWNVKYNERGTGLPLSQIQRLGRQILEALLLLKERGFPPYGHLHSGNVILQNGVARLSGLENTLLNFKSRIHPIVWSRAKLAPSAIDIICFGHVLFEMSTGYELTTPQPTPGHLQLDLERYPQVVEVLELIFQHPEGRYPTIEELLICDLFRNIDLREMRGLPPLLHQNRLSSPTRALLAQIKKSQLSKSFKELNKASSLNSQHSASTSDISRESLRDRSNKENLNQIAHGGNGSSVVPTPKKFKNILTTQQYNNNNDEENEYSETQCLLR